jgi:hypothetical protein
MTGAPDRSELSIGRDESSRRRATCLPSRAGIPARHLEDASTVVKPSVIGDGLSGTARTEAGYVRGRSVLRAVIPCGLDPGVRWNAPMTFGDAVLGRSPDLPAALRGVAVTGSGPERSLIATAMPTICRPLTVSLSNTQLEG